LRDIALRMIVCSPKVQLLNALFQVLTERENDPTNG
jgi:hypothetical protein